MRLVFVTLPASDAEAMLLLLLRERLVAGGSIVPTVHSRYWWNGEIVAEQEAALFMETSAERVEEAVTRLKELHPYACPRVVVLRAHEGPADYFRWIRDETREV
ncbi:MAG: divalent-cation tolerance protein CutA [Deltaproteobacteria bacterium]|jgi:periplasmic divalent cation tolerance protein|nr:divalent-cation tolerance protein CutA [Deltaproteobacteria bacterium]MBK9644187.1 divalent-cation tolerance protein CutA [Deltaproteobacteria bacterium]MCK6518755.1 divalent cation tolerance protein CutA [Myxococcota bacterium]